MIPTFYKWHLNSLIKDTVKDYFTVNICWSLILNFLLFWQEILQVNSDWHVFYKGYLFFNDYRLFLWFCDKYLTATAHSHNFIWTENTNFSSFCWFWCLNLTSQLVGKNNCTESESGHKEWPPGSVMWFTPPPSNLDNIYTHTTLRPLIIHEVLQTLSFHCLLMVKS